MLQFDKAFHPVVLYEYYLICIFIKLHENLKNEGKSRRNYKPMGGVEVRSILHSYGLLYPCQMVQLYPLNGKRSSPKKIGMAM